MTTKTKCKLLNLAGAVISFAAPAAAAIAEFPRVEQTVAGGGRSFADILNLSSAAFSIIVILLAVTCWRFFREHIKLPKSGLITSLILFAIAYGVEQFIHSFRIIMFWSVIGCAIAQVLYIISDRLEGSE
ncbi:MAG: hypothetical protein IJX39_08695 [Clostridia bacterium]|nr:hypothetical protein [Clostridia bacterium]